MSVRYDFPLTFEIEADLHASLQSKISKGKVNNLSQLVRLALESYDFSKYRHEARELRQISVRLSPDLRDQLVTLADKHGISFGEILRIALDALSKKPLTEVDQLYNNKNMPTKKVAKKVAKKATKKAAAKKVVKKAAKKVVAKKAAKKAVKKAPAKKAAKKAVKKAPAKKAAKKAVKKAPAKKAAKKAVKKAPAKKAVKKAAAKKVAKKAAKKK